MIALETPRTRRRPASSVEATPPRVLVATAGDEDSIGALRVAAELSAERQAEVLALGVASPFPHTLPLLLAPKSPVSIDEDSRLRMLSGVRDRLGEIAAAKTWTKRAVVGWPSDVINSAASAWHASLIVLGIGRHGRMDRLFGTETAIAVMKHARLPVLAVASTARGIPRRACAAVDFTPASVAAALVAAELLPAKGRLMLVHACAFTEASARPGNLVDVYRAGARAKLDETLATVRERARCRVTAALVDGEPSVALLAFARREECDLITLGGHEQGLMDRILLGSVRTRVLRGAKASVLIAPPRPEEAV